MKKSLIAFAAALLTTAILGMGTAMASEIDTCDFHEDSDYGFNFSYDGASQGTKGEIKGNTSPVYVKVKEINGGVNFYVDGNAQGRGYDAPWINLTAGTGNAYCYREGTYSIHSDVVERFGSMAYARLTAIGHKQGGYVNGVWSPDSYQNWTFLN